MEYILENTLFSYTDVIIKSKIIDHYSSKNFDQTYGFDTSNKEILTLGHPYIF